nr:mitochondrial dicarboxylate carrier [Tanacetum cinerariifolium]
MGAKGFVEGGVASIVAGCSTHPLDLIKVRMQLQGESLPVHAPHAPAFAYNGGASIHAPPVSAKVVRSGPVSVGVKIFQTEGVGALFSGISATVLRQTLYSTTRMGLYEIFREKWTDRSTGTHVSASFAAGFVASVASNPVDVIKTRVMNMKVTEGVEPPYKGAIDCAVKTVRAEGPMALYKGFIPTISRQGPFTVVLFVTLEQVRKLLKDF